MRHLHLDYSHSQPHTPQPRLSQEREYERAFREAMFRAGISYQGEIKADGFIHRFPTGKKGRPDGWYVYYGMAGAFGDWRQDIHERWSLRKENLPYKEPGLLAQQMERAKKAIEEERSRKYEEMAHQASQKWVSYSERGSSPYLANKKIETIGIRFHGETIVIPLRDRSGKLWSLQYIYPDGTKRFLTGGRKKGCFHILGTIEEGKSILITEGYATGVSLFMATHRTTVIAFDAGNLEPVIQELKQAYPKSPFLIAGDEDCWQENNIGRLKAEEAAKKYNCRVVFPSFKDLSTHPTDFNDLHVLEGLESVQNQVQEVLSSFEWPEPKPIHLIKKDLLPIHPFPPELIPEPYQDWLIDIAERMQCPLDYVAIGAIVVTASLIGAGCGIRPKRQDAWTVIPNLWGGIVGAPSTLKSPALKEILRPLEALEAKSWEVYEKERHQYLIDRDVYQATKEAIKKEITKAVSTSNAAELEKAKEKLKNLKEPQEPICQRYSTNDTTIEKMRALLSQNPRGLLLYRDELMGLLTSWDKVGHESDRAFYLEAWNGYGSTTTDRIGRGTIYTKNLCVSILGSTQPSKLFSYFQRTLNGSENDGLLQRFQLFVYPDERKKWELIDRKPNDQARVRASITMTTLASMDFSCYGASVDTSEIPYFHFDTQAQEVFYEWLTELEGKLRTRPDESLIIEHLAKYRKLMPSLALIFHLINIASGKNPGSITRDCVERAAGWCDYLETHAHRIYASAINSSYQAARNLARKIQEQELRDHFDKRDVYRKEWSLLKKKEEVEAACHVLIESGWLRETQITEGGRLKSRYQINPKLKGKNSS